MFALAVLSIHALHFLFDEDLVEIFGDVFGSGLAWFVRKCTPRVYVMSRGPPKFWGPVLLHVLHALKSGPGNETKISRCPTHGKATRLGGGTGESHHKHSWAAGLPHGSPWIHEFKQ
uniref:Uncharacterized protein n=1 Tax=Ipomoea trifida TaxID=35884 RepID=A0A948_IPOTF|nr:hypothetical protein [Ipomoea trifida]